MIRFIQKLCWIYMSLTMFNSQSFKCHHQSQSTRKNHDDVPLEKRWCYLDCQNQFTRSNFDIFIWKAVNANCATVKVNSSATKSMKDFVTRDYFVKCLLKDQMYCNTYHNSSQDIYKPSDAWPSRTVHLQHPHINRHHPH